jgi:hypothetical protein
MATLGRWWLAAAVCAAGCLARAGADEPPGPPADVHHPKCPKPSYSCCHYWLPSLYTFRAYHSAPCYVPAPIDPALATVRVERYPCPLTTPANQADYYREPSLLGPVVEKAP